jgi:hypothetical protein
LRRAIAIATLMIAGVGSSREARACQPTIRLSGDRELVRELSDVVADRGIAVTENGCPATAVTIERRGTSMLVRSSATPAGPRQDLVTDSRTAATVIESWVRTDLEAPLLAPRHKIDVEDPEAPDVRWAGSPPGTKSAFGIRVVAVADAARASDSTTWFGVQLGACVTLGPICASGRARFAAVAAGPRGWHQDVDRNGAEVLLGAEVPWRVGRLVISPGFAAGAGWIYTHEMNASSGIETAGARAELSVSLSYPLSERVAAELALSYELARVTYVATLTPAAPPEQELFLAHLAAGLRFGGL